MSDKRFKITLFALGTTVGIVVGAGVVYFMAQKQTNVPTINEDNLVNKISNKVKSFLSAKKVEDKREAASQGKSMLHDVDYVRQNSYDETETESKYKVSIDTSEQIDVKKDELIKMLSVDVLNLAKEKNNSIDSVLQILAGTKVEYKTKKNAAQLLVEFWQSPINYRGYQLTKNKLVVFGLNADQANKVIVTNDKTFFQNGDVFYKLDYHNDFKSLDRSSLNEIANSK